MNKPTCESCRYYLDADDTKGYCGNVRVGRIVRAAAHACPYYEPDRMQTDTGDGESNA